MSRTTLANLLARTLLFGSLSDEERDRLACDMKEVRFMAGQSIFSRGDKGHDIYLVSEGRVRLSVLTSDGRELSFAHIGSCDLFGEIAVIDGGVRSTDATAVTAVVAHTLGKSDLMRHIETYAPVRDAILHFLCQRVREADKQMEGIALYPIEVRLARFFLAAARQKAGSGPGKRIALDLPMSQGDLALLLGASRPKVNAALISLSNSGAIERSHQSVNCDIDLLEDIAGQD